MALSPSLSTLLGDSFINLLILIINRPFHGGKISQRYTAFDAIKAPQATGKKNVHQFNEKHRKTVEKPPLKLYKRKTL